MEVVAVTFQDDICNVKSEALLIGNNIQAARYSNALD